MEKNPCQSPVEQSPVAGPGGELRHPGHAWVRRDKRPTASLLFGVALIQLLVALFLWSIHGPEFQWVDWAYSLNFLIFAALAIWARWSPAVPATIAFLLYAAYLGVQAWESLDLLRSGWIFKLPVAVLLTIAFVCAFVCRDARADHP